MLDVTVNLAFWVCCLNFVSNIFFFFETGFEASIKVVGASEPLKLISLAPIDV